MHYQTDVNAVDYRSITGRSLTDSYALSDRCERCRLHVDHRAFTVRPNTYYETNDAFLRDALPHQSPHSAATQVWVFVYGVPVQHTKCHLLWRNILMQPPGKYRDKNVILISTSVFHWAGVIGNVAETSSEIDLCLLDCPACFCQLCSQNAALVHMDKSQIETCLYFFP